MRPSLWVIIAANLVPVAGVLFWGWKVGDVIWLYWFENLVVGAFNAVRMSLAAVPREAKQPDGTVVKVSPRMALGLKAGLTAFFLVHFGGFCFVHGLFVAELFPLVARSADDGARLLASLQALFAEPLGAFAALAIVASHAFGFVRDEILARPAARTRLEFLMFLPYPRIVAIHLFLLAGGLLIEVMDSPVVALLVFVVVKIALDATLYGFQQRFRGGKTA